MSLERKPVALRHERHQLDAFALGGLTRTERVVQTPFALIREVKASLLARGVRDPSHGSLLVGKQLNCFLIGWEVERHRLLVFFVLGYTPDATAHFFDVDRR